MSSPTHDPTVLATIPVTPSRPPRESFAPPRARLFPPIVWTGVLVVVALLAVLPLLNLVFPNGHALHVSAFTIALLGKFMCYAIAALALDLVWGYTGILSLGHGLFFALGGYAHGMYLMRATAATQGADRLPDFMNFLDWKAYPGSGPSPITSPTRCCWWCWRRAACAGVRLLCLPLAHQGRVFLDHHAGADLRRHVAVLPQ